MDINNFKTCWIYFMCTPYSVLICWIFNNIPKDRLES